MRQPLLLLLMIVMLCNVACKQAVTKQISDDKFKVIVWDMVSADQWAQINVSKDSANKKSNFGLYEDVFKIHQITKDEFYNTLKYYQDHPNEYKILMDSVDAYGSRKRQELNKVKPAEAVELEADKKDSTLIVTPNNPTVFNKNKIDSLRANRIKKRLQQSKPPLILRDE